MYCFIIAMLVVFVLLFRCHYLIPDQDCAISDKDKQGHPKLYSLPLVFPSQYILIIFSPCLF